MAAKDPIKTRGGVSVCMHDRGAMIGEVKSTGPIKDSISSDIIWSLAPQMFWYVPARNLTPWYMCCLYYNSASLETRWLPVPVHVQEK